MSFTDQLFGLTRIPRRYGPQRTPVDLIIEAPAIPEGFTDTFTELGTKHLGAGLLHNVDSIALPSAHRPFPRDLFASWKNPDAHSVRLTADLSDFTTEAGAWAIAVADAVLGDSATHAPQGRRITLARDTT